ncbi:MAG TPA: hypothetical protein VFC19_15295 [Candidatus Limnocylindrales bacterium]|nr:hypothetical protein [Candidatus Limnocylindrales bacterium]
MPFETWQIPVLVMAGIIVVALAGESLVRWKRYKVSVWLKRPAVNAAILAGLLVFFAIGFFDKDASLAGRIVTGITGIMNVGMTYWTYQSFQHAKRTSRSEPKPTEGPADRELQETAP